MMNENGLNLIELNTELKNDFGILSFSDYSELEKFLYDNFKDDGSIIVYLDYKVLIRKFLYGTPRGYDSAYTSLHG